MGSCRHTAFFVYIPQANCLGDSLRTGLGRARECRTRILRQAGPLSSFAPTELEMWVWLWATKVSSLRNCIGPYLKFGTRASLRINLCNRPLKPIRFWKAYRFYRIDYTFQTAVRRKILPAGAGKRLTGASWQLCRRMGAEAPVVFWHFCPLAEANGKVG